MSTFRNFYSVFTAREGAPPAGTYNAMFAAFRAGQNASNVITAEQVKATIIETVAEIEDEARALADGLSHKDQPYLSALVLKEMGENTQRYHTALAVMREITEQLENGEVLAYIEGYGK